MFLGSKENWSDAFIVKKKKKKKKMMSFKFAEASNPGDTICLKKVW